MSWIENDNKIWFNPAYVNYCCVELVKEKGIEQIKKDGNYQKLVESYDLSLTALAVYRLNQRTHELPFIQLSKQEIPDGYLGQASKLKTGNFDISQIELTRYDGKSNQSLLEQLKSSGKVNTNYQKYDSKYVLLIKLDEDVRPNFDEVRDYLNEVGVNFAVWALQVVTSSPDTIIQLTVINPQIQVIKINVGEIGFKYKDQKIPNIVEIKRTGSVAGVRKEVNNELDKKYSDKNFGWLL